MQNDELRVLLFDLASVTSSVNIELPLIIDGKRGRVRYHHPTREMILECMVKENA